MSIVQKITDALYQQISIKKLVIHDESFKHANHAEAKKSQGGHYAILIVSESFINKNPLERHRLINSILKDQFKNNIHALSITALTPEEYQQNHEPA